MNELKKEQSIVRRELQQDDFNILLNDFLNDLDVMENTRSTYRRTLIQFYNWIDKNNTAQLTRKTILDYKKFLESTKTPLSVCTYLIAVRKFFQWAEIEGKFKDIAKGIKGARINSNEKRRDPLTAGQEKKFLEFIREGDPIYEQEDQQMIEVLRKRDYAIFMIMFNNACRCIEINRADIQDMRPEGNKMVLYVQQKRHTEKDTMKVLSLKTYNAIQEYIQARPVKKDDPLFVSHSNRALNKRISTFSISGIFKRYAEAINIKRPRIVCHSTRHTAINRIIEAGASQEQASLFAGHESLNSIKPYYRHKNRIENPVEEIMAEFKGDQLATA